MAIFQLYHGDQFLWCENPEYPERSTNHGQATAGYDTYYHHTDPKSAVAIVETRQILQSENKHGDAIMGNGVYLTKLGPVIPKHVVAKNNFDGFIKQWRDKIQDGKTTIVLEMKLPKDKVQNHSDKLKRNVYLHPGIIYLSEVKDLKIHVRKDATDFTTIELVQEFNVTEGKSYGGKILKENIYI